MTHSIPFPEPQATDADLVSSLRELAEHVDPYHCSDVEALIQKITDLPHGHRVAPIAFAWFRELALKTLYPESEKPIVDLGLDALRSSHLDWQGLKPTEILTVTPNDERSPYNSHGWSKLLNEGTNGCLKVEAPAVEEFQHFLEQVESALVLLQTYAPSDYAQWRDAMRMIVAVRQCSDSEIRLAGGSSLFLPGVMVVNVQHCDTTANTLATLVHEAAHVRLNSLCSHEPLSLNAPDTLFASPLRSDGRPMEGVIHATFVCATIVDLFSRIAESLDAKDLADDYLQIAIDHKEPVGVHTQQIAQEGVLTRGGNQVLAFIQAVDNAHAKA